MKQKTINRLNELMGKMPFHRRYFSIEITPLVSGSKMYVCRIHNERYFDYDTTIDEIVNKAVDYYSYKNNIKT